MTRDLLYFEGLSFSFTNLVKTCGEMSVSRSCFVVANTLLATVKSEE